jgi:hypothetical protein
MHVWSQKGNMWKRTVQLHVMCSLMPFARFFYRKWFDEYSSPDFQTWRSHPQAQVAESHSSNFWWGQRGPGVTLIQ